MTTNPSGGDRVEAGWRAVHDGRVRPELLDLAYAEPRLRQLFPWIGMGELHFSRCTEQRWAWDIPYIQPAANGGYWVSGPLRSQTVGPAGTAAEAVAGALGRHTELGPRSALLRTEDRKQLLNLSFNVRLLRHRRPSMSGGCVAIVARLHG
ncbi:DUF6193 family natural product biosynthesis protein [Streptomyces anulatus]